MINLANIFLLLFFIFAQTNSLNGKPKKKCVFSDSLIWPNDFLLSLNSTHNSSVCRKICSTKDSGPIYLCYANKTVAPSISVQTSKKDDIKLENNRFKKNDIKLENNRFKKDKDRENKCEKKIYLHLKGYPPLELEWDSKKKGSRDGTNCIGSNLISYKADKHVLCSKDAEFPVCEKSFKCQNNPCIYGNCTDTNNDYFCNCLQGYTGKNCEININECLSNPCQNNGKCVDKINDYECQCPTEWTGENCNIDNVDDCKSNPCIHGSCEDILADYKCKCIKHWSGKNCSVNISPCSKLPCKNGAICYSQDDDDYLCVCEKEWGGKNCTIDISDSCISNPCLNNGTCQDLVNNYTCTCKKDWRGENCEIDGSLCANNPCKNNGTCQSLGEDYLCLCKEGWSGENCSASICFNQPCKNGGRCVIVANDYLCECAENWGGKNCDVYNGCLSNPCLNLGSCVSLVNDYQCICNNQWTGKNCEKKIAPCSSLPCNNGATCQTIENDFKCMCKPGWSGRTCDIQTLLCEKVNCLNNGICTEIENDFKCNCIAGFTGKYCQTKEICDQANCIHGVCTEKNNLLSSLLPPPSGFNHQIINSVNEVKLNVMPDRPPHYTDNHKVIASNKNTLDETIQADINIVMEKLKHFSKVDLENLCNNEDLLLEYIEEMKTITDLQIQRIKLLEDNEIIAVENLEFETDIEDQKGNLKELVEESDDLYHKFQNKSQKQDELLQMYEIGHISTNLRISILDVEEDSENIADQFLSGSLNLENFLEKFLDRRKLTHTRRAKEEILKSVFV